jgi:hypothetical protein
MTTRHLRTGVSPIGKRLCLLNIHPFPRSEVGLFRQTSQMLTGSIDMYFEIGKS